MDESADGMGDRMPLICGGVYADGSHIAADIARMADAHDASALLCFPPGSLGMGGIQRRPEIRYRPYEMIADATDLPMIVFQYGNELAYPLDTLVQICGEGAKRDGDQGLVDTPQVHDRHIKTLHSLPRRINVLLDQFCVVDVVTCDEERTGCFPAPDR